MTSARPASAPRPGQEAARPAAVPGVGQPGAFPTVALRYNEAADVEVCGPATGRSYRFSGEDPLQRVDARDAAILLRGAAFQPA
jgi:hypothetical protein